MDPLTSSVGQHSASHFLCFEITLVVVIMPKIDNTPVFLPHARFYSNVLRRSNPFSFNNLIKWVLYLSTR